MAEFLTYLAENVDEMLGDTFDQVNDLVNIAVAGELLRRGVASADVTSARADEVLERYNGFLAGRPSGWPETLEADLGESLKALGDYARLSRMTRDTDAGAERLDDVEAILATAAARMRAGQGTEETLESLAARASEGLEPLVASLLDLAQHAEDKRLQFGPDPDYNDLYGFTDELATYSHSYMDAQALVTSKARRLAMRERAAEAYAAPSAADRILANIDNLLQAGQEFLWSMAPRASAHPVLSHASDEPLPEQHELGTLGDLSFVRYPEHLHLVMPEGHALEVVSATAEDGTPIPHEPFGETGVRLLIPENGTTVVVELRIDGTEVRLPAIAVKTDEA